MMAEGSKHQPGLGERVLHCAAAGVAWGLLHPARVPPVITPRMHGLPYERVRLRSQETDLAAWYIPHPGSRAGIVLCHGRNNSRQQFHRMLRPLHEAGFHLFLFDFRAMGLSRGDVCTYGYRERGDVLAAVEWLRREAGVPRVGLYGWSLGGAAALLAAAADPEVPAVVTDSAFASLEDMVEQNFFYLPAPLREPVGRSVRHWAEHWCGNRVTDVDPEAEVRGWRPRPLLVIHGERDLLIPVRHGHRLAAAAGEPAELWTIPGAWHTGCLSKAGGSYVDRVVKFFKTGIAN